MGQSRSRSETAYTGTVTWRLINMLSLNHLGLIERGAGKNGQSLKETLSMFADLQDSATERKDAHRFYDRERPSHRSLSYTWEL